MKAVILGATQGMGRELARQICERGDDVFMLGRDATELEKSARDLEVRAGGSKSIGTALCDLEKPEGFAAALDAADAALSGFDTVIVTAGMFATQERLEDDIALVQRLTTVNFANTVVFCEHARKRLLARGGGTLVVFSSVAGERGRKPVIVYGASKAGLSAYLEGLDHKFRSAGLVTVCVKPGFVKTGMTAGLKPPPFAAEPADACRTVLAAMKAQKPVVYAPSIWAWIMLVIRFLPRFVMRKIGF